MCDVTQYYCLLFTVPVERCGGNCPQGTWVGAREGMEQVKRLNGRTMDEGKDRRLPTEIKTGLNPLPL